jgi:hypothetical protein
VRAEGEEGEAEVAPAAFEAPGGVPAVHEDDSGALLILPGRAARGKAKAGKRHPHDRRGGGTGCAARGCTARNSTLRRRKARVDQRALATHPR